MSETATRLLVVEPDAAAFERLIRALDAAGAGWYVLASVPDIYAAQEKLEEESFDAILLAWGTRGASLENLKRLRADAHGAAIVVMTAVHDSMLAIRSMRAGVEECFVKGQIEGRALRILIRAAAERSRISAKSEVESIARHRKLQEMLRTDELTGLSNAPHFLHRLEQEMQRSSRYQRPLTLAALRVDEHGAIGDTHGSEYLDQVLVLVARIIERNTRRLDEAARLRGVNFGLLLVEATPLQAQIAVDRIRLAMQSEEIPVPVGQPIQVTLSCGLAGWTPAMSDPATFLRFAEEGVSLSMSEGGNRVKIVGA